MKKTLCAVLCRRANLPRSLDSGAGRNHYLRTDLRTTQSGDLLYAEGVGKMPAADLGAGDDAAGAMAAMEAIQPLPSVNIHPRRDTHRMTAS
jgi:hypothetical protein